MSDQVEFAPLESSADGEPAGSGDLERLYDVMVELTVEVGRTRMTLGQALALGPGSVVTLDRLADNPVDLLVNGAPHRPRRGRRHRRGVRPAHHRGHHASHRARRSPAFATGRLWTFVLKPFAPRPMTRADSSLPSRSVYCESPLSSTGPPPRPSAWCCSHRPARSRATGTGENTPLSLPADSGAKKVDRPRSGGGSLVRTFVGLAIVLAVIYGVAWVLKQVKRSKEDRGQGTSLETTAVVALGPNRSLHLVRAGRELVLVGVAEHGVTPIRTYTEDEAIDLGLIGEDDAGARRRRRTATTVAAPAPCAGWTASRTGRCGDEGARRHQRRPAPAPRRRR